MASTIRLELVLGNAQRVTYFEELTNCNKPRESEGDQALRGGKTGRFQGESFDRDDNVVVG